MVLAGGTLEGVRQEYKTPASVGCQQICGEKFKGPARDFFFFFFDRYFLKWYSGINFYRFELNVGGGGNQSFKLVLLVL